MSDDKQCFFVESPDGRKFKMVIRGDLGRLSVAKIRRYLGNYGIQSECALIFNGRPLLNDMVGDDFGLANESVIHVQYGTDADAGEERESDYAAQGEAAPMARASGAPLLPQEAWTGSTKDVHALRAQLATLQAEKKDLEEQVRTLTSAARGTAVGASAPANVDPFANAQESLRILASDLGLPLVFDASCTCVLNGQRGRAMGSGGADGLSLLISYDAHTQRIVLYTTLLTQLPFGNPALLSKLYEILLEGSLLGREVCGGGIGISRESGLVVLHTSFSVTHCSTTLLRDTVPVFVETVTRWRELLNELLA